MADLAVPGDLDFMGVVNVTGLGSELGGIGDVTGIADAIAAARDKGLSCYFEEDGRRVAALVPVAQARPAGVSGTPPCYQTEGGVRVHGPGCTHEP